MFIYQISNKLSTEETTNVYPSMGFFPGNWLNWIMYFKKIYIHIFAFILLNNISMVWNKNQNTSYFLYQYHDSLDKSAFLLPGCRVDFVFDIMYEVFVFLHTFCRLLRDRGSFPSTASSLSTWLDALWRRRWTHSCTTLLKMDWWKCSGIVHTLDPKFLHRTATPSVT